MGYFFRKELIAKGYSAEAFRKKVRALLEAGEVDYGTDDTYSVLGMAWAALYPNLPLADSEIDALAAIVDAEWDWYFEEEPISFEKTDPTFESMHPRVPAGSGPPSGEFTFKDGNVIPPHLDKDAVWDKKQAKEFFRRSQKFLSRWKKTLERDLADYRQHPLKYAGVAEVLRSKGYTISAVGIQGVNESFRVTDPSGQTFFMKNSRAHDEKGPGSVGGPNREKAVQRVANELGLEGVSIPVKRIMKNGLRLTIMPFLDGMSVVDDLEAQGLWTQAFNATGAESLVDMMLLNHLSGDVDKHQLNSVYWRGRLWGADYGRAGHFNSPAAYDYVVWQYEKRVATPPLNWLKVKKADYLPMLDRAESVITKLYDRYGAWGRGGGKGRDWSARSTRDTGVNGLKARISNLKSLFGRNPASDTILVADIAKHLKW